MQDITPRSRKSIRDIPIPDKRARNRIKKDDPVWTDDVHYNPVFVEKKKMPRWRIWGAAAIALIVVVFAISVIFEHATVRIVPKSETVSINSLLEFSRSNDTTESSISYDVIELSLEKNGDVKGTEASASSSKARGTIVVYNNHSKEPFELVERTRFESPSGNIYRIQEPIQIPGLTNNGNEAIPGQIEVEVIAEETGSDYNVDDASFTVPGLKGNEAFSSIYAETKTSISGGATEGEVVVSPQERDRVEVEFKNEITNELLAKVGNETPDGYIFLDDVSPVSFNTSINENENGPNAVLNVKGSIKAVIVDKNELAQNLITAAGKLITNDQIDIPDVEQLKFEYRGAEVLDPTIGEVFSLTVTGQTTLVWEVNKEDIKSELFGVSKKQFERIMAEHDEILSADLVIRPIWKRKFPENKEDIEIINTLYDAE